MTSRADEIAAAWVELQSPETLHRIRPHVIRAARGHATRAARAMAMFGASTNNAVTSDELRAANATGVIAGLRDDGADIETYRHGRAFLYIYRGGIDPARIMDRGYRKIGRQGVFRDRYQPLPTGADIYTLLADGAP